MSNNKDENINTLYIPTNIKTRFEFFDGFGFTELAITTLVTAFSIFIAIIIEALTHDFYKGVLVVLVTMATTAMAVKKNEINQSITDMVRLSFRFINTQQKYKYKYINKYEHKED
jgi:thiamine phosphate synthase YjbQ (UPF0047 family)